MKPLHIAVGVVRDATGRILVSQRKPDCAYAGQWEFPGGKCEPGEPVQSALARELQEELAIEVVAARPLIRLSHRYPDRYVLLDTWWVTRWQGSVEGREGQRFDWALPPALDHYPMLAANRPILRAVQLPDHYLITPGTAHADSRFLGRLEQALVGGVRLLRLREPALDDSAYPGLARECLVLCQRHGARLMLDRDTAMVQRLGAHGLHLSAQALAGLAERPVMAEGWVAASCHNRAELEQAARLGLDFAVLGPVADTPSHPQAPVLGWENFTQLVGDLPIPVYAIGGLTPMERARAWQQRAQGIAAIRGLWPA